MDKHTSVKELLCNFMNSKDRFLVEFDDFDNNKLQLQNAWKDIQENKEVIVDSLIKLRHDTTKSLYCNIQNSFIVKKLPNNIHALYLIEAIIRNDYLFNRRTFNHITVKSYFLNDNLNYLTYKSELTPVGTIGFLDTLKNKTQQSVFDSAYNIYKKHVDSRLFLLSNKSPIEGSEIVWNDLSYSRIDEKILSERTVSFSNLSYFIRGYKLDFLLNDFNPQ